MRLSVYMGDKTLFDALYSYWTSHSAGGNASTLMTWCIQAGAGSCPATGGSATDADEDVAWALIQAGKQWGSATYSTAATAMISQIYTADIDATTNVPKGGSNYSSPNPTNPSYFAPAYYRVFATIDMGHPWNNVAAASYTALANIAATFGGGLVPAWCAPSGSNQCGAISSNNGVDDMRYQYDAHRVPWRIGIDACWNGGSGQATAAKAFLLSNTNFFVGKTMAGIGRAVDIYQMGGAINTADAKPNSMSAIGSAGVGAMANAASNANAKAFLDRAYRFILDANYTSDPASATTGYTYFNASVGLLSAITMSGNFNSF
jgi:hypothetical protein